MAKTKECKHDWDKDYRFAIRQCLCCGGMQQSQELKWGDVFIHKPTEPPNMNSTPEESEENET